MERRRHPRITWWAAAILFAGLLAAEIVYFVAGREEAADTVDMTHTKMFQHNMELVGGKAAVLAGGVADWLAGLWHGRPLAYTIAILTLVVAGVCFVVGWLQAPKGGDR